MNQIIQKLCWATASLGSLSMRAAGQNPELQSPIDSPEFSMSHAYGISCLERLEFGSHPSRSYEVPDDSVSQATEKEMSILLPVEVGTQAPPSSPERAADDTQEHNAPSSLIVRLKYKSSLPQKENRISPPLSLTNAQLCALSAYLAPDEKPHSDQSAGSQ